LDQQNLPHKEPAVITGRQKLPQEGLPQMDVDHLPKDPQKGKSEKQLNLGMELFLLFLNRYLYDYRRIFRRSNRAV
jgi:hypothetical protein